MMNEYVYCRILAKGKYLGYDCPKDNIRFTYSTYKILKAAGVPIEIYDPVKEQQLAKQRIKETQEKYKEKQEEYNVLPDIIYDEEQIEDSIDIDIIDEDIDNTELQIDIDGDIIDEDMDNIELQIDETEFDDDDYKLLEEIEQNVSQDLYNNFDELCEPDEFDLEIDTILDSIDKLDIDSSFDVETSNVPEKPNYKVYTKEELLQLTKEELINILKDRGYTRLRDPYAAKARDNKTILINKILNTQID